MFIINKEKSQNLGPPDTFIHGEIAVDDNGVDKDEIIEGLLYETDEEGTFISNCNFLFQKIPILVM